MPWDRVQEFVPQRLSEFVVSENKIGLVIFDPLAANRVYQT